MKILVTGATGQVGFELVRSLSALGEVVAASRDGRGADVVADLSQPGSLAPLIERVQPRWIVNAAAYTAVDKAESESELANRVNGEALEAIGAAAKSVGARVLHYSTDYVFDGRVDAARRESDAVAPINAYGRSKLLGEEALAASGAEFLVFRTAWVYAARGHNFLRTMLKLGATRERLTIVADQHGSPTSARWLAEASAVAIARSEASSASFGRGGVGRDPPFRHGIFHASCAGRTTWFHFAQAIFDGARQAGLIDRIPELVPIATSDYPTRAARPAYSVLDGARLEAAFGIHRPDWRVALTQTLAESALQVPRA